MTDEMLSRLAEAIWENAPDAMMLVDDAGLIVKVNGATLRLFGYTAAELVGQPVEVLVPHKAREGHIEKRSSFANRDQRRLMGTPMANLRGTTKGGSEIDIEVALSSIVLDERRFVICVVRDVRARTALEEELRWASTHDALTGLYNRAYLDQELSRLAKGRRFPVAVIVIDIDGLKPVNDVHGHAAGDRLLTRAATLFAGAARGDDVVARVGGDEFVLVLPQTSSEVADGVLLRLTGAVAASNESGEDHPVHFSAGIGIALEPADIPGAMRDADDRMYAEKRRHRRDPR